MALAAWTAIVFFGGIVLFTDANQGITVTSYGHICVNQCEKNGGKYFYCQANNNDWDYCSPVRGMGAYGRICKDKCAFQGKSYLWCNTVDGSWDYCSKYRSHFDPVIMGSYGGRCTNQCAKHGKNYNYCKTTTNNWDYCSPVKGKGAYGSSCGSDHPCGKHDGKDYTWCYTDNGSWDYCSIFMSEFTTGLTRYGYHCFSACMPTSNGNYYYCYYWNKWDCCSPKTSRTYQNKACRADHVCEKHGENYFWCYTSKDNHWDYCSPKSNCAYWPAHLTPVKGNKRKKSGVEEFCRVGDSSGRARTSFYMDPDARNRVTAPRGTSENNRAQAMIAQWNIMSFRGNENPRTLYSDDNLGLRIDLQDFVNRNGRRYANIQLQTNGQGSVSLAAVLIRTNTSFSVRHIRRALLESLKRSMIVTLDKNEASSK